MSVETWKEEKRSPSRVVSDSDGWRGKYVTEDVRLAGSEYRQCHAFDGKGFRTLLSKCLRPPMVVLAGSSTVARNYTDDFPDRLGWMLSPGDWKNTPDGLCYALDNGAFGAYLHGVEFDAGAWLGHVAKAIKSEKPPRFLVVPDVVTKAAETLELWEIFAPALRQLSDVPLALAVQDGMTVDDVLELDHQPDIVFIGGTKQFKIDTLVSWCRFDRVHVGGVNSLNMLWECDFNGVESVDGSGWFRGDQNQLARLVSYLRDSKEGRRPATLFNQEGARP